RIRHNKGRFHEYYERKRGRRRKGKCSGRLRQGGPCRTAFLAARSGNDFGCCSTRRRSRLLLFPLTGRPGPARLKGPARRGSPGGRDLLAATPRATGGGGFGARTR